MVKKITIKAEDDEEVDLELGDNDTIWLTVHEEVDEGIADIMRHISRSKLLQAIEDIAK